MVIRKEDIKENKNNCIVCGSDIMYLPHEIDKECYFCHKSFKTNATCESGHYICDSCHSSDAMALIEKFCLSTELTDPVEMANILMKNPAVKMHGPEHHFLIPAVLLASYYNFVKDPELKNKKIPMARTRAEKVPGGNCGFLGNCGAAVGTGIFVSLLTDATPLSKNEWRLSNLMTSECLHRIAVAGGPRCCKRNTFIAISEAVKFLEKYMGIKLITSETVKCKYMNFNKECIGLECPFYPGASDL